MKRTWMSGLIVVCGLLLPLVPALAACGPTTPAPSAVAVQVHLTATPEPSVPLEGTEWELTALLGTTDVPIYPSWALTFNRGNSMEATCGCRRYVADYTTSGSEFRMGEVHTAESGCQPHDRPGEMFAEALAGITAYHASEERLAFYNAAGEAILVYARDLPVAVDSALAGMWLLESLNGRGLGPILSSRLTCSGRDSRAMPAATSTGVSWRPPTGVCGTPGSSSAISCCALGPPASWGRRMPSPMR